MAHLSMERNEYPYKYSTHVWDTLELEVRLTKASFNNKQ
jgi:hypothetical protein